jgi:hypothetical protein
MLELGRAAVTEVQKDDFYATAAAKARRSVDAAVGFDPVELRDSLLSGRDIPASGSSARTDIVHLVAAVGLGAEEIGAEALVDAFAASGLFPQVATQQLRETMIEAFECGDCAELLAALGNFDPVRRLEEASIDDLRQAREVATGLAGFGALLLMHALLMPDSPGLERMRARIAELGMGPTLMNLARQVMQPQRAAFAIVCCLDVWYLALYKSLSEFVAAGPPLMHLSGDDDHDPDLFMATWLASIRGAGDRAQNRDVALQTPADSGSS